MELVAVSGFRSIMALSYTTEVMNDISAFLAYALTLRLHMLMGRGTVMVTKADCMLPHGLGESELSESVGHLQGGATI